MERPGSPEASPGHVPVLLEECIGLLAPALEGPEAVAVDCTLGLGGHAEAILRRFPAARLIGIDRDSEALRHSRQRLGDFGGRVELIAGNFRHVRELLAELGSPAPAAILADLGVSSMQLDVAERGFSFRQDGPLDMRMGLSTTSAEEVVNRYPEAELERIFREYGEEPQARRVARAVARERRDRPITTTGQLHEVVVRAKGRGHSSASRQRIDPATRVFQALRIEVNEELASLEGFITHAAEALGQEGRLVIISYHSLEDRLVKHTLRHLDRGEVDPITGRPKVTDRLVEVLTRKPVRPTAEEIARNPRSRSARLRAARRL